MATARIYACRAAQAAGIRSRSRRCRSARSRTSPNVEKPFWFQLYVMKDRGFIKELIQRAMAAKCSALVLTVDLQVIGQRHQDIKNGMTVPPEWSLSKLIDLPPSRPGWRACSRASAAPSAIRGHLKVSDDITSLSTWINSQFDTR